MGEWLVVEIVVVVGETVVVGEIVVVVVGIAAVVGEIGSVVVEIVAVGVGETVVEVGEIVVGEHWRKLVVEIGCLRVVGRWIGWEGWRQGEAG